MKIKSAQTDSVIENPWQELRTFTAARIAMGRAGVSQPTSSQLEFQYAHACARDAVNKQVDWKTIHEALDSLQMTGLSLESCAGNRDIYLQRPDLGRKLSDESIQLVKDWRNQHNQATELCIVIADGLSAFAIEQQVPAFLKTLTDDLAAIKIACDTVFLVTQGRVAIGDEIASLLNAKHLVVLIGERPGLSSPDSLSIYYTYQAQPGCTDAQRNCISNIRPEGLGFTEASRRLIWLLQEASRLQLSGVQLKDQSSVSRIES